MMVIALETTDPPAPTTSTLAAKESLHANAAAAFTSSASSDTDADPDPALPMTEVSKNDNKKDLNKAEEAPDVDHYQVRHPTSWTETLVHLLRGNIGSGVFAMGDAFHHAGLVVAPILTLLLAVACVHSMHILIKCANKVGKRSPATRSPDFADTVELCFASGPTKVRRHSITARKVVNVFLCITQLGFCCVYFVFIATNMKQVMDQYITPLDVRVYMAFALPPILLSSWVRSLKYLAPLSAIANGLMAIGLAVTLYFCSIDLPPLSERKAFAGWGSVPLYFGTAIFAFEGIGLVLPLQNEMRHPKKFAAPLGVLNIGMTLVTILFTAIGFLGYLKFGEDVLGSVTLNLPPESPLAQAVKVTVSIAMTFTYALQFYVPMDIMWPSVKQRLFPNDTCASASTPAPSRVLPEIAFRTAFVLLTFTLAELVPKLDLAISLVGAVSSTALALLFPPISELMLAYSHVEDVNGRVKATRSLLIKDVGLIVLGVLGFFTGTYASLRGIVLSFDETNVS